MLARLGVLLLFAALGCGGGPDVADAAACEVEEAPPEASATCGTPPAQCCNLPWCGPEVPDSTWFCATHSGGAHWCCACADASGDGTVKWGLWKMECGIEPRDGGGE